MKKKLLTMLLLSSLLLTGCSKLEKIIDILLEEETEAVETQKPEESDTPAEPEEQNKPDVPEETEPQEPEVPENPTVPGTPTPTEPEPEEVLMSDNEAFVGYWEGSYVDKNGNEWWQFLTLSADGGASYSYGPPTSEMAETFGGTWGIADNYLALNLTGGVFDMAANYVTEPYSIEVLYNYTWGDIGNVFTVTLKDGTPLLAGTETTELGFWKQGPVSEPFDPMLGITPPVYDPDLCIGNWYSTYWHEDGYELSMHLALNEDGTASYNYGLGYSDTYEMFDGTWTADSSGKLTLDMHGGWVYAEDSEQYDFDAVFQWSNYGNHLSLSHEEGNPLIGGCEGWGFEFLPFDFTLYDGEWVTFDDARVYNLNLLSNGEAVYRITEGESTVCRYEGWWYASDTMELELSMQLAEGEGDDILNSSYELDWAEFPVQMIIRLKDSGFALTNNMAASGEDTFNWIEPNAMG